MSGFTALVQIASLGWTGFTLGALLGWTAVASAFLGASLAISSTMVVAAIFRQDPVDEDVREHVLAVLIVQDLVAIVLIATMTALAEGQSLAPWALSHLVARLAGVLAGMLAFGILVVPRLIRRVVRVGGLEGTAVLAVGLSFGFALLAQSYGYSVALGAFVAGVVAAEFGLATEVEHAIDPLRAVFSAIFFVSIGMAVDPSVVVENLHIAALVSVVVILAQFLSVAGASVLSGIPLRRAVFSGLALGQIGEMSFILATIGTAADVVPDPRHRGHGDGLYDAGAPKEGRPPDTLAGSLDPAAAAAPARHPAGVVGATPRLWSTGASPSPCPPIGRAGWRRAAGARGDPARDAHAD